MPLRHRAPGDDLLTAGEELDECQLAKKSAGKPLRATK